MANLFNLDKVRRTIQSIERVNKPRPMTSQFFKKQFPFLTPVDETVNKQTTKAFNKDSNIAALQLQLWNAGFFRGLKDRHGKNITYNTAVDGMEGDVTRQAMQRAIENGYQIKEGKLLKPRRQQTKTTNRKQRSGLSEMYQNTHAARTGGMSTVINSQKYDTSKKGFIENLIDNIYPYGYSDNKDGKDTVFGAVKKLLKVFSQNLIKEKLSMNL